MYMQCTMSWERTHVFCSCFLTPNMIVCNVHQWFKGLPRVLRQSLGSVFCFIWSHLFPQDVSSVSIWQNSIYEFYLFKYYLQCNRDYAILFSNIKQSMHAIQIKVCTSWYIYTVHVSSVTCATNANANASCNSWYNAIKIPPCSKTVSARQMRTFCFLCNEQEDITRQSKQS